MSYPIFKDWKEEDLNNLMIEFKELEKTLNELNCEVILHGGTLLGSIREGDLIAKDNDIDFIIMHKSTCKEDIKKEIIKIDEYFNERKALCGDLHFLGNNHYFINGHHFDGWQGWIDENDKCYIFYHIYGELEKNDVYPLKQVILRNQTFNIPNKPEKLLNLLYGKKWKSPSSNKPKINPKQIYKFFDGHRFIPSTKKFTQKELLLDLKSILDTYEIPFWLMAGTLLGAIRENDFLKHDPNDIDIGLYIEDYWKVKELLDKSDFKYKFQWNKELAIYKGNDIKPHIDLFFHTVDEKNYYCYSYKPNKIDEKWNHEWRMFIPKEVIEPLKNFSFLDDSFKIPNQENKYLELLYGETWNIPDTNWKHIDYANIDISYSSITAIVTTFKRNESLINLIDSFCNIYPEIPLIIGNQNKEKININYPNIKVIDLPEDCGLSYSRNELVKQVDTEFTLLLEDDFIITKKTNIFKMLEVFSYDKNIGIVGGRLIENKEIKCYEKFLIPVGNNLLAIDWNKLISSEIISKRKINNIEFGMADIIYNFFLARTKVLKQYPWDNNHKVHSEHMDFFLNLKLNSKIKIAFIPDVLIEHNHVTNPEYEKCRQRMYYNLIYEKYGIEKGYTLGETALINYELNKKESL